MHKNRAVDDPSEIVRLVRDERIRMHTASARSIVPATIVICTLVTWALYEAVEPRWGIVLWWACFVALMALRLTVSERWAADPARVLRSALWERRLTIIVGITGLMWGLTGTLLYPTEASGLRPISAIVQMGVSAAAVSSLSSMQGAYRAFFLLMMLPNILWLATRSSFAEHLTSLALVFFTLLLMISGRHVYTRIEQNIRLQLDLAKAVRETEAALAAARSANEAKSLFVANISHELRTPMHAILGFAQLGKGKTTDNKLQDYFERIRSSGQRLLGLINDLLDLSKLEAGQMSLSLQRLALRPLVDAAAHEFEPLLHEHSLHLVIDEEDALPPVMADTQRLGQLIRNLLSNAVKFSPHGASIHVRLKRSHDEATRGWVQLIISDEGPGIPPGELETVFDKFVQSSKTSTGAGGTGLGLAISREIALAHHGRIHAHNSPTGGAILVVEVPAASPRAPAASVASSQAGHQ